MLKKLVRPPCPYRVMLWLLSGCLLPVCLTAKGQFGKTPVALVATRHDENAGSLALGNLRRQLLFEARVRNYVECLMGWAIRRADLSFEQKKEFQATLNSRGGELNAQRLTYDVRNVRRISPSPVCRSGLRD